MQLLCALVGQFWDVFYPGSQRGFSKTYFEVTTDDGPLSPFPSTSLGFLEWPIREVGFTPKPLTQEQLLEEHKPIAFYHIPLL